MQTVVRDRRNASKRIHVEGIIGCAKTLKILNTTLNSEETSMGGKITSVLHANQCLAVSGNIVSHMNENIYILPYY